MELEFGAPINQSIIIIIIVQNTLHFFSDLKVNVADSIEGIRKKNEERRKGNNKFGSETGSTLHGAALNFGIQILDSEVFYSDLCSKYYNLWIN